MKTIISGHVVVSISIVSHGQINLIKSLLVDINEYCKNLSLELILTLNLEEDLPFATDDFLFPLKVIHNVTPLGFAANHNNAFEQSSGRFFCVLNPDVRLIHEPFTVLLECLKQTSAGMVAPLVVGENGEVEDNARTFPTPFKLLCKIFGGCNSSDYVIKNEPIFPDWVAGMFMLFPSEIFDKLYGFNDRFFLYYEDVDLCARLRLLGYNIVLCPSVKIVHIARRSSHRNLKYLKLHLTSMLRFFCSTVFLKVYWHKFKGQM